MGQSEFAFIEALAPLTRGHPGALDLKDDAASLNPAPWVISADMLVSGVHFRPEDPLDTVAMKALRVNVSDLIAKGAEPHGYFLSLAWPTEGNDESRARLVEGLRRDGEHYGLALLGGDTVSTPGPLSLAITMLGKPGARGMIPRAGAAPGQNVFVTGTVGDAGLGLAVLQERASVASLARERAGDLIRAYQKPEPPFAALGLLREHAMASLDVSDGLLADAAHLARASGVRLTVEAEALPLSQAAADWLSVQPNRDEALSVLASAGDDYQTLFCSTAEEAFLVAAFAEAGVRLTRLGRVLGAKAPKAPVVEFVNAEGKNIMPPRLGFTHF